jgi:hypothetical protein
MAFWGGEVSLADQLFTRSGFDHAQTCDTEVEAINNPVDALVFAGAMSRAETIL